MALNLGKVFITAGCNKSWDVTVRDKNGVAVDISTATDIEAIFVKDMTDGIRAPVFSKTLADGDVVLPGQVGVLTIIFTPDDTQSYTRFTTLDYGVKIYLPGSTIDEEDIGRGLAYIRIGPVAVP